MSRLRLALALRATLAVHDKQSRDFSGQGNYRKNAALTRISQVWQYGRMSQTFGIETPGEHTPTRHRKPVRYLIVIEAGGAMIARLFLDTREMVAEFDAAVEEVTMMTTDLVPEVGALNAEWDRALQGHSAAERAAALVYTLEI